MSKRSVNFGGSLLYQQKHMRLGAVVRAMRYVGMTREEIKAALTEELNAQKCTCGPFDGCAYCAFKDKP